MAMFVPFLIVILAAGTPINLAILSLAYFLLNLGAALTHYGTTPAPIYFGAGYTTQRTWWWLGFITSLATITILEFEAADSPHGEFLPTLVATFLKAKSWLDIASTPLAKRTWYQGRYSNRVS